MEWQSKYKSISPHSELRLHFAKRTFFFVMPQIPYFAFLNVNAIGHGRVEINAQTRGSDYYKNEHYNRIGSYRIQ